MISLLTALTGLFNGNLFYGVISPNPPPQFKRRRHDIFPSKFFGGRERQAAFAVEKFFQPSVAGTCFTPDDGGRDLITQFATIPPPLQPIFVADGALNRNAGDF
jgi:hypothetical protein